MTLIKECIDSHFRMRRLGDFNLNKVSIPEHIPSGKSPEFHERALRSSPSARYDIPRYNNLLSGSGRDITQRQLTAPGAHSLIFHVISDRTV